MITKKEFKPISLTPEGFKDDPRPITAILMENENIWVSTNGNGLKKVLPNGKIENYLADGSPNSLSDNFVTDIEDRENGIWVATQDGLNYFDKSQKKATYVYRFEGENTIANNSLTTLFTDSKNRLWIGADYDGLSCFDENSKSFFILNKKNGLTDATIKSISEDSEGNLWVSSEDLLFKIVFKNKKTPKLNISDIEITSYSSKDGLSVKQFSYNSGIKLKTNELVFGASKGLTIFRPENIVKLPNDNDIVFTKLIVNNEVIKPGDENSLLNQPISETCEITLNNNQGYLGIEFSNLNFVNPKNTRYGYKLDDFYRTDEWHDIGTQNNISFSFGIKMRKKNILFVSTQPLKILYHQILTYLF